ncbi:MAG: hypothetical protein WCT39_02980 [Candidatus Margulisiibacteriota bacterium]
MRIVAGTKRWAIVTSTYTYKVPKLRVGEFIGETATAVFDKQLLSPRRSKERTETFRFIQYMFSRCITAGWEKNRTEFKRSNGYAELAVKTLFSFWGFVNVQGTAEPCNLHWAAVLDMLSTKFDSATFDSITPFSHALASRNFGFHHGRLKFVDYGNAELAAFVFQHMNAFEKALAEFHLIHNT